MIAEHIVRAKTALARTTVILDNLSSHKSPKAAQTLRDIGCWFLPLPPCSPDLNPIEMAFAKLKTLLRKAAARTYDDLWKAVGAVCDLFTEDECLDAKTKALKALASQTDMARRLQTMPGVGPLTALAVEAFAPDMAEFKGGRDFAAWLGLVPRQHSTGGKARLGRTSKAGQTDIRRLLIIGAMTRIMGRARRKIPAESWIGRMLARKPKMLVGIALANKMARRIWAMLTKNEDYRDPALAMA
ncbi:MAG: transposase [Rubellimicrobium sp.]|nr:transposase [Rubellimicrobium sp.]